MHFRFLLSLWNLNNSNWLFKLLVCSKTYKLWFFNIKFIVTFYHFIYFNYDITNTGMQYADKGWNQILYMFFPLIFPDYSYKMCPLSIIPQMVLHESCQGGSANGGKRRHETFNVVNVWNLKWLKFIFKAELGNPARRLCEETVLSNFGKWVMSLSSWA